MSSSGISKDSILYLDGPSPVEKQATTTARELRRARALQHALTSVADLEQRVECGHRVRRRQFSALNKHIRAAFYWPLDAREDFARHMCTRGWNAVVCPSEADIAIADACTSNDVVISTDSDMLAYDSVRTIWRPISRGRFLKYDVAHNDYACSLARMGVITNFKIVKSLEED
ncbi:hypothetical protein EDD11_010121, partial [Mortierella claussenii]